MDGVQNENARTFTLDEVEENKTFYYSNFKLFNECSEILFAKYLSFKKNLQAFLGDDWNEYAKVTISKTIDGSTVYVQSADIFHVILEIWLELRKEINFNIDATNGMFNQAIQEVSSKNMEEEQKKGEANATKVENKFEENKVFELFQQKVREKYVTHHINEASFKAIIQAFYISAIKVWKETLNSYFYNPLLVAGLNQKNEGFLMESKNFLLNKIQNLYKTKSKMLKPILVATERIRDYMTGDTNKGKPQPPPNISLIDEKDMKNMSNFTSNLQLETPSSVDSSETSSNPADDLRKDFKNLRIDNTDNSVLKKRTASQANTIVEIKKVNKKLEKLLNQNMIEFAAHYVNNITKSSNADWQISRNFVTNMVEVNYNKLLELENKLSHKATEVKDNIKIRFIQPAQEFYNRLMEVWIIFKTHSFNKEVLFTEYLEKVKGSLGGLWNDRFLTPTQNFFMTLYYEWNHLKQGEQDTEEKVLLFIKKVKENMLKIWEENIVKKAEELSNKTIAYNK